MKKKPPRPLQPATLAAHLGRAPQEFHGAVNTPVYYASTILFPSLDALRTDGDAPASYGRRLTPSVRALQDALSELEGGAHSLLTPSGVSAIALVVLAFAQSGDHVLLTDNAYAPTRFLCRQFLQRFQIRADFYDPRCGARLTEYLRPNTRLVFVESPGSLTFEVQDLAAIARAAHKAGAVVAMDNTWATPLFFQPLKHGADLALQSGTKYLVGHADAMLGTVTTSKAHWPRLLEAHRAFGLRAGPEEIFLALRGLRTLPMRLAQHYRNGVRVARWLAQQKEVAQVLYPALPSSPDYKIWKRDFSGAAGLFSIILKPHRPKSLAAMLDRMRLFKMGYSWGGYESLILPAQATRRFAKLPAGQLLRLHIGLEDAADLQADLADGLARLQLI